MTEVPESFAHQITAHGLVLRVRAQSPLYAVGLVFIALASGLAALTGATFDITDVFFALIAVAAVGHSLMQHHLEIVGHELRWTLRFAGFQVKQERVELARVTSVQVFTQDGHSQVRSRLAALSGHAVVVRTDTGAIEIIAGGHDEEDVKWLGGALNALVAEAGRPPDDAQQGAPAELRALLHRAAQPRSERQD